MVVLRGLCARIVVARFIVAHPQGIRHRLEEDSNKPTEANVKKISTSGGNRIVATSASAQATAAATKKLDTRRRGAKKTIESLYSHIKRDRDVTKKIDRNVMDARRPMAHRRPGRTSIPNAIGTAPTSKIAGLTLASSLWSLTQSSASSPSVCLKLCLISPCLSPSFPLLQNRYVTYFT